MAALVTREVSFRTIVHNLPHLNSSVQFVINDHPVPARFNLKLRHLNLTNLKEGEPNCVQLAFQDEVVDVTNYYYYVRPHNCELIDHDTFFRVADIVAYLYGTRLSVKSDHSYKVINGFGVPSSILSMTKPDGMNFYRRFGLISPINTPAYQETAPIFRDRATEFIHRIEQFEGTEEESKLLKQEIKLFSREIEQELNRHRDNSLGVENYPAFKTPDNYKVEITGSNSIDGVYTPIALDKYYSGDDIIPPFLRIEALMIPKGGRKSVKRKLVKRKSKNNKRYIYSKKDMKMWNNKRI